MSCIWHDFAAVTVKCFVMLIPIIALLLVLILVIRFVVLAAKKKNQGDDLGDRRAGAPEINQHT